MLYRCSLKPCVHRAYRFGFLVLSLSLELALKIALQWTRKKKVLSHLKESDRPIFRPKSNAIEMKTSSFLSLSFNLYRFLLTSMKCIVIFRMFWPHDLVSKIFSMIGTFTVRISKELNFDSFATYNLLRWAGDR